MCIFVTLYANESCVCFVLIQWFNRFVHKFIKTMALSHIAAENEIPFRRFIKLRAMGEGMHRLLKKFSI